MHFVYMMILNDKPTAEELYKNMEAFCECCNSREPSEYAVFNDIEDSCRELYNKNEPITIYIFTNGSTCCCFGDSKILAPKPIDVVKAHLHDYYPCFEYFAEDYNNLICGPNDRYGYYHNPNAIYDWFVVGGRWGGMLKLKEPICGEYNGESYSINEVDEAFVRDIDFESMCNNKIDAINKLFDVIDPILRKHPKLIVLNEFVHKSEQDAWDCYNKQPIVKALRKCKKIIQPLQYEDYLMLHSENPRGDTIDSISPLDVYGVIADGKVEDRDGYMEKVSGSELNWCGHLKQIISNLHDDQYIIILDCHI